jgi:hypothetical protein
MASFGTFTAGQVLTAAELNAAGAWTTVTPTWAAGVTTGNGTWSARYSLFNKILFFQGIFTCGSTTAITAAVELTLPASLTFTQNGELIGNHQYLDSSTLVRYGGILLEGTTSSRVLLQLNNVTGTMVTTINYSGTVPVNPMTAGNITNDTIGVSFVCQVA